MWIDILVGIAVLFAFLLITIARKPAAFAITRSAVIPASPDRVFALVNDFHEWDHGSPWAKIDPNCKNTFDGPTSGVGAKFAWDGNGKVGSGRMEITESKPNEKIALDLIFSRPMKANNLTVFTFHPEADGTKITWTMSGHNGFMGKAFNTFVDCDKMIGKQFDEGLENMKKVVKIP